MCVCVCVCACVRACVCVLCAVFCLGTMKEELELRTGGFQSVCSILEHLCCNDVWLAVFKCELLEKTETETVTEREGHRLDSSCG